MSDHPGGIRGEYIYRRRDEGATYVQIAHELGVSNNRVRQIYVSLEPAVRKHRAAENGNTPEWFYTYERYRQELA